MWKRICGIYKITNKINNKSYIGQSINIKKRWSAHKVSASSTNSHEYNSPLHRAMRKYGFDNFEFEIIKLCEPWELNQWEGYYADLYKSYTWQEGYNVAIAGIQNFHYGKLNEKIYWEIVDLLRNSKITGKEIAQKFQINEHTVASINQGSTCIHPELTYPIRTTCYRSPKTPEEKQEEEKKKVQMQQDKIQEEKKLFLGIGWTEDFFLKECYEKSFTQVASELGCTKKVLQGTLKRIGLPYKREDYKKWYKSKSGLDKKEVKYIYQIDRETGQVLNVFHTWADAARGIHQGEYNQGAHIRSAALQNGMAYGYYWELRTVIE